MPPLITNNAPLGNAFGGKIATLNYNYQPNTQPSSATITVISENNKFIEPELLSDFTIPLLGAKTKITEVQYNDDGNVKVLQIELQDRISFILDKNLILIRGIHTSGVDGDIFNGNYTINASLGVKNSKYNQKVPSNSKKNSNVITIGGLQIKKIDKNNCKSNSEQPDPCSKEEEEYEKFFAYTLNDLFLGIKSLGLKIKGSDFFTKNLNYTFTEAGSVRSVLNGCLSKLGRSFYIDPVDDSIVITDNIFLTKINDNIKKIFNGNINNLGATSLNIKKSCKDVVGRHLVIKSTPLSSTVPSSGGATAGTGGASEGGQFSSTTDEKNPSGAIFRKVSFDKSEIEIIDRREKELIKRIAYLYGTSMDDYLIELYLFALGKKYNPHQWSDYQDKAVYGGIRQDCTTYLDKTDFMKAVKSKNESKPIWQTELELNPPHNFDIKKLSGAYTNTRTGFKRNEIGVEFLLSNVYAAASPDKLRQFVEDLLFVAKGVFISPPIASLRRADGWDFVNTRGLQMIGPFKSSERIINIPELAPIQRLFDRVGGNPNLTIDNLRMAAGQSGGLQGNPYFWIGITNSKGIPVGPKFNQSYDIPKLLEENFYILTIEEENQLAPEQYLYYTENSNKILDDIEKVCLHAWQYTFEEGLDRINIRYIYRSLSGRRGDDSSAGGGGGEGGEEKKECPEEEGEGEDCPTSTSISILNKFSEAKFSSRVELDFYEGPIGDAISIYNNADLVSIEQDGPFYEASISYFRPPISSDLDVNNGFSSLSSNFSAEGVSTSISYSTNKYLNIDKSVISQIGSSINTKHTDNKELAFTKNQSLASMNKQSMRNSKRF